MKINRYFAFFVALSLGSATLMSCAGNDEEEIIEPEFEYGYDGLANPKQVFVNGMPTSINTMTIHNYSNGLVGKIVDRTTTVKFEYIPRYSSLSFDVVMSVTKEDETKKYNMYLNGKGFITEASLYSDESLKRWEFEYASGGYLTSIKKEIDGRLDKFYLLKWDNDNLVEMKTNYLTTDDTTDYEYGYDSKANKGAIMFYNSVFAIDIDDLEYAYFAGILGMPTKNIPLYASGKNPIYSSALILPKDFKWSFNNDGFPTDMKIISGNNEVDEVSFKW